MAKNGDNALSLSGTPKDESTDRQQPILSCWPDKLKQQCWVKAVANRACLHLSLLSFSKREHKLLDRTLLILLCRVTMST